MSGLPAAVKEDHRLIRRVSVPIGGDRDSVGKLEAEARSTWML
jgi:hypothetical protein